ncbi:MAG: hypothetical protein ACR2J8_03750 [Thermomicrobiales bacterium]
MEILARALNDRPMTRRALLAASAAVALTPVGIGAQDVTPPAVDQTRIDGFVALSAALVGGGRIDPKRAEQFLTLNDATDDDRALLDTMIAAGPATVMASPGSYPLISPVLTYWYIGEYKGAAVPGRDTFWYGLSSWQAVKYTSSTSICKRFGDWAEAPKNV